jgi:hypothetical protein
MDCAIRVRRRKLILLGTLAAGTLVGALCVRPVPQNPAYHQLADQRTLLGVPHFFNVASNALFLVAGLFGLYNALRKPGARFEAPWVRAPWLALAAALFATGLGSAYYHWAPADDRLFWDRLPMAVGFGAVLGVTVIERIGIDLGRRLWVPLLLAGPASLIFWRLGGDLRFYGLYQGWAILFVPLILLLFPARSTGTVHWVGALACYALAKVFEMTDAPVYRLTGAVSGHTLKHVCAGAASGFLAWHLHSRRLLDEST